MKMIEGDKNDLNKPLIIGKPSGALCVCGLNEDCDITITKKVIDKAMRPEIRDETGRLVVNTGHGLKPEMIIRAINELESPIMIFTGKKTGSLIVLTGVVDQKNRSIVVAIEIGRQEGFSMVNSIRSIYGRDNLPFFIVENIEKGNLVAANKEKADELLRSIGKWYPKENTFINFS